MKNKKTILLFLIILLFVTGCGYTREEKKLMREYEKQAKVNATNYIKAKYNINPEIIKSKSISGISNGFLFPDFFPGPSGYVWVTLKYKNKEFYVYIAGDEETIDGKDNFQSDEIKKDIVNIFEEKTSIDVHGYDISYGITIKNNKERNVINAYYDGNNLSNILSDNNLELKLYTINQNIGTANFHEVYGNISNSSKLLINFKNKENLLMYLNNVEYFPNMNDYNYANAAMYVDSLLINNKYYDFDIQKYEELYYYSKNQNISLTRGTIDNVNNWNNEYYNYRQISKAYSLNLKPNEMYIYINSNQFKDIEGEKNIGIQCISNNVKEYYIESFYDKFGNYYTLDLNTRDCDSDISFVILEGIKK